jgi:exodeoxyribonuclease X
MDFRTWPPLLVVDVEGNGATPPDLVEVAAVPIVAGTIDGGRARSWLIRPPRPINAFAQRVHGISNDAVADQPGWDQAGPQVQAELHGVWIAAHDAAAVEHRVLKAHLPDWEPAGVLDTLRLARAVWPDAGKHNLDALIVHAGIDTSAIGGDRHRAGFDAAVTAALLLVIAKRYDTFTGLAAVGVPAGLPGAPSEPEAQTLW